MPDAITHPDDPGLAPPKPRLRGVSHHVAFYVSLAAGSGLVVGAPTGRASLVALVYAVTVSGMLGASALLHRGDWSPRTSARLTRLDHTAIFLVIAGTYTPIGLYAIHGALRPLVLGLVWGGAMVGIAFEWSPVRPPRGWVTAVYLTVGWVAVLALPQLWDSLGAVGFALVAGGGVLYTVGAVVHAARRPDPLPDVFGYHEIFHAFVVAAAAAHFCAIAFVVLPRA
ncbi:MAG: hemolysin III family protein [Acidimicrobiia bacterium]|nr:hemolysin III family protein [Acidimicrobiia bacterium]